MKERQPESEINNLPEFQSFCDSYVSGILANPPNKNPFPNNLPPDPANTAMYTTKDNPFHEESIKIQLKGIIFIDNIPWNSIPESLRRLLSIQYLSAESDVDKKINLQIGRRGLRFFLESTHSHYNIDLKGEYYSPGLGLRIIRTDLDDEVDRMVGGKRINEGDFIVIKTILSTQLRLNALLQGGPNRDLTDEEKEFLQKTMSDNSWRRIQLIPSKLVDLQDIARLLMEQREKAFIYSN